MLTNTTKSTHQRNKTKRGEIQTLVGVQVKAIDQAVVRLEDLQMPSGARESNKMMMNSYQQGVIPIPKLIITMWLA